MKHTSKRLQALVLVLAMCVSFLQIPSFAADDNGHSGDVIARRATFASDGSFTVTKSCDEHPNASEKVVSGKIVKDATNTYYIAVDKDGKELVDEVGKAIVNASNTEAHEPTCATNGTIKYDIIVDGKHFYSDTFVTAPATGKHTFAHPGVADDKLTNDQLEVPSDYKLLNDTATCLSKGEKTYAKICHKCGQVIETETVKRSSDISDHHFIKDEKGNKKEFEEVIEAATCSKKGEAYHYIQCNDCGQKLYDIGNKTFNATAKKDAEKFDIPTLPHTYEYKVVLKYGREYVTKADKATEDLFTVESKCTVCSDDKHTEEDHLAKVTKVELVADKTVEPKFDCVAGSKTYKVTYEVTDYSKEKVNNQYQTKKAVEEVTVPYYNNYSHDHDRTRVYVPDEESIVKATCTKDGHYNLVNPCKVCGDKEVYATIKIPATGKHTAAAAKKENVVAATTKKGGSYDLVVRCADCGEIISSTHKTTAKIVVNASKINSVKNYKGKKAKVTVKKAASVIGYQIQYSTRKDFKGAKYVNTRKTSKYLTKLAKKKYYVRVRTYKTVDGKLYYSSWSGAKTVTIKK